MIVRPQAALRWPLMLTSPISSSRTAWACPRPNCSVTTVSGMVRGEMWPVAGLWRLHVALIRMASPWRQLPCFVGSTRPDLGTSHRIPSDASMSGAHIDSRVMQHVHICSSDVGIMRYGLHLTARWGPRWVLTLDGECARRATHYWPLIIAPTCARRAHGATRNPALHALT